MEPWASQEREEIVREYEIRDKTLRGCIAEVDNFLTENQVCVNSSEFMSIGPQHIEEIEGSFSADSLTNLAYHRASAMTQGVGIRS